MKLWRRAQGMKQISKVSFLVVYLLAPSHTTVHIGTSCFEVIMVFFLRRWFSFDSVIEFRFVCMEKYGGNHVSHADEVGVVGVVHFSVHVVDLKLRRISFSHVQVDDHLRIRID